MKMMSSKGKNKKAAAAAAAADSHSGNKYGYTCADGNEEERRNEALRRMRDVCEIELKICPACATSSALYFAGVAAVDSLGMGLEEFVDLARRIYRDVAAQSEAPELKN
jgi:hypothetical protein